jgi:DNA polymerase III delta prime subunit
MEGNKLNHANVVVGENGHDFVLNILEEKLGFKAKGNPDFWLIESEVLGIDDARDLSVWAIGKPLLGEVKVSLLIAKSITQEAQNALLKVLEEPPLGTYIFINIESLGGILPTFMSRVRVLERERENQTNADKNVATKFLRSDVKGKLAAVNSLAKKTNKSEIQELIKNLEEVAYRNDFASSDLKNIMTAKIFTSMRGSSPKMLLEWLSCVLQ